jgi:hypothetical protein
MRYVLLVACIALSSSSYGQCHCQQPKEMIYMQKSAKNPLYLCGDVLDSFGKDKIISEFIMGNCHDDTLQINQMHNEGASFLFQLTPAGYLLTEIDLSIEDKKYDYPQTYLRMEIVIKDNKATVRETKVKAAPVVSYLRKNFKKTEELY